MHSLETKVEGEAYINVRKGKIIPGYEISLTLGWAGEAQDAVGNSLLKAEGLVEIPYIMDENADEDPDVRVTLKDEGPIGKKLKEAFLAKGKTFLLEQVRVFVAKMAKAGPAKEELAVKKVNATNTEKKAVTTAPTPAVVVATPVKEEVKKE
ncbi:hypothetical protein RJ639_045446 [Escallonia herrerae]|uniref:Activator of Hsp90 ATPase AHSA1-like N-terminal domain-containing protein n=1 Tax=Escallonia herrerae TaxID=1293975 RepID=A0AA89AX64_9ASTE|nr:hypothetical protein RJ639_045446 [Escallonia herrerae]